MSETPGRSVQIRFAGPDDAAVIHGFVRELAEYEREPDAVEGTPDDFRDHMMQSPPPFECLIAEDGDEALGFALFFHNYSTWKARRGLYLEDLYVPPRHRGCGVGRDLLAALARIAVERDCARLEWAVLDWNEPAIGFYEKLGAAGMDEWTTFRLTGAKLRELGA